MASRAPLKRLRQRIAFKQTRDYKTVAIRQLFALLIFGLLLLSLGACSWKPNPSPILDPVGYRKMMAEKGAAQDQFELADMYRRGWGLNRDHGEAIKWYVKAAKQSHVMAKKYLGEYLYHGGIVRPNFSAAAALLSPAAEKGDKDAQYLLGTLYATGTGVKQDKALAMDLFEKAANQGQPAAKKVLDERDKQLRQQYAQFRRENAEAFRRKGDGDGTAALLTLGVIAAALASAGSSGNSGAAVPYGPEIKDCMHMTCQELWDIQQEFSPKK